MQPRRWSALIARDVASVLTVDDRDAKIGLDNATEVEAAGGSLLSVDEDHVDIFELVSREDLKCRSRAPARGHCKERWGK